MIYKIFDAFSETNSLISADFVNGLDGFVMSIGVIIAIIIGVVVLITGFAIVIVCCCCKAGGNQYDQHGEETNNRMAKRKRTKKQQMVWKTLHKLLQLDSKLQQIINCI
jgi:hypothetical protein